MVLYKDIMTMREWMLSHSETDDGSGDNNVSLNRTGSHLPSTSALVPLKTETSSKECHFWSEGFLPADLLMKSPDAIEKNNLAVSTSIWNNSVKSTSDIVPFVNNEEKTSMPSFICKQHEIYKSSYNLASRKYSISTNYHSYYSFLIREKKMSSLLDPHRSWFLRLMQSGPAHLPHDPLASSDGGLDFVRDQHQKMQKYIGTAKFSSQTPPLGSTKPENFHRGRSSVPRLPCSVHEVGTMKIFTTIDSVEESSRFKENSSNKGMKVDSLGSSMESEGKDNVQDLKTPISLKTEIDTINMNALKENYLLGDVPLPSNKCPKDCQNSSTSQAAITSAREKIKAKRVNTAVPHINQGLTSPLDDRETSTSRTGVWMCITFFPMQR